MALHCHPDHHHQQPPRSDAHGCASDLLSAYGNHDASDQISFSKSTGCCLTSCPCHRWNLYHFLYPCRTFHQIWSYPWNASLYHLCSCRPSHTFLCLCIYPCPCRVGQSGQFPWVEGHQVLLNNLTQHPTLHGSYQWSRLRKPLHS